MMERFNAYLSTLQKKQEIQIRCDDNIPKSQVPEWDERILLSKIKHNWISNMI